jgi:DNA-binding response OmpR family regulator
VSIKIMAKILLIQAPPYPHDDMIGHRLRSRGYEVILAETRAQGLSMAVSAQPDLIAIDLSSREIDGAEIMRAIEADPRIAPIPNLALASSSEPIDRQEAARVGCDDYDCKPMEMARIIPKIEALLAHPNRGTRPPSTTAQARVQPPKPKVKVFRPTCLDANVLIIDDSQINREMLTAWLKGVGYNPLAANGGAEGLAMLRQYPIELVLLDVVMPEMNGLECLKQIRLEYPQATLPVIMATSRDGSKEMVEAFELGANDYLIKPLDLNVSLARIDNHLRMAQVASGMLNGVDVSTNLVDFNSELLPQISDELQSHSTLPLVDPSQPNEHPVALNRYKICQALSQAPRYSKYLIEDIEDTNPSSYILKHLDLRSSNITVKTLIHHLFLTEINTFREFPKNGPVAKLLKSGHQDGQYFLIEECIQGRSLSEEIHTEGSLVMRKVLGTTIDLLEILVALHRKSIVHQTLQPSSFVRRSDGRLVLNDVGIFARLNIKMERSIDREGDKFRSNHTKYAAPEQYYGVVDPCSDIYSIGMILLELLTRKKPKQWLQDPVSHKILWEQEISVGSGLGNIINRMLAPNLQGRYSSAIETLEDIYNLPMVAMLREHGRSLT